MAEKKTTGTDKRLALNFAKPSEENDRLFDASLAYTIQSYKALTLISGAAAIALLAFMGHLASGETLNQMTAITRLSDALWMFGLSAFIGAFLAGISSWGIVILSEVSANRAKIYHRMITGVEILILLIGWALFLWGLSEASEAFKTLQFVKTSAPSGC